MAQKAFTMIFYIVPEDSDDIEQPNAFGIHKNQEDIKQNDITDSFPLPGEYIFRYRYKFQNSLVWMDINANSNKIPLFNGKIYVKATRISWNSNKKQSQGGQSSSNQAEKPQQPQQSQQQAPVQPQKSSHQQQQRFPSSQSMEQQTNSSQNSNIQAQRSSQKKSTNLLDDYETQPTTQKKQNQLEADLLDMDDIGGSSNTKKQQNKVNDDLWNF